MAEPSALSGSLSICPGKTKQKQWVVEKAKGNNFNSLPSGKWLGKWLLLPGEPFYYYVFDLCPEIIHFCQEGILYESARNMI